MFVDGKSIKWEREDGRPATVDEVLRIAVRNEASGWDDRELGGFSAKEIEERIWNANLPTADEFDTDSDIPALICSSIQRGLPVCACYYCGVSRDNATMHIDHILPRSRGGKDTGANTVQACKTCNLRKSDNMTEQFRGRMAEWYGAESAPTFFGEIPKVRRVLEIETQTPKARHPNLKPAEARPLSRMGTSDE